MLKDKLQLILQQKFGAKIVSGGREAVIHCKYCNDKGDHGHLYIKLPDGDSISLFNCFKCGTHGVLDNKTLLHWESNIDADILIELANYNKKVRDLPQNRKYKDQDIYYLRNIFITDNDLSRAKLGYINRRLGTNMNYQDLLNEKIVLNLYDVLNKNNITDYSRKPFIMDQLNESFIGFITVDNAFINLRNLREGKVSPGIDSRYINYNIFNKFNNTQRFYVSPVNINISDPNPIKLRIAEGAFDILSIKYNVVTETYNNIYASILGSSYFNIIKYFIAVVGLINLEIHIYIDSDINVHYFDELIETLYPYNIRLYIHKNVKEGNDLFGKKIKDFGVPKEMIDDYVIQLL